MKIRIPCLVGKTSKSGVTSWYWQPSKTLKEAGWEPVALGKDEGAAIAAARIRNQEVERWKVGGPAAAEIKPRQVLGTLGHWIERYRRQVLHANKLDGRPRYAPATIKRDYEPALRTLEEWAGKHPLAYISRARVRVLATNLAKGRGAHTAHNTLKVGRLLFKFVADEDGMPPEANPFLAPGLETPPPRDVVWSPAAREAIIAQADKGMPLVPDGPDVPRPSIALACVLGFAIGQREQDLLAATIPQYVAIPEHKMQPEDFRTLAGLAPDGVPRGVRVRQMKTKAWIEVPVVGDVRRRIEANIERARKAGRVTLLLDDARTQVAEGDSAPTLRDWTDSNGQTRFQRDFADVRAAAAAAARNGGDEELAAELERLQFRDLRRTCVVYLGELGLEDHLIAAITGHDIDETRRILKTYMPRTTGRAARAIALASAREQREAERAKEA